MASLPELVVDPFLVCLPRDCDKAEQLYGFVEGLLAWSELLRRKDVAVHFSGICLEILSRDGYYPYSHEFKQLASRLGADAASAEDVCRVAQEVLDRTPSLEERCAINIVDFDDECCQVIPDVYITRLAPHVGWGFKHGLTAIACLAQARLDTESFVICSATSAPEASFEAGTLEVSAHINALDCSEMLADVAKLAPLDVRHEIPVAFNLASFLEGVGCLQLWLRAKLPADVSDAIYARVREILGSGTGDESELKRFKVGDHFLESARRYGFGSRLNVVDSCARILLGVPKNSVEPFRISLDSSEQRIRGDGARAFRTHLTKDGPAYRLMFWHLKNELIEFANIGPKRELVIL